MICYILVKHGVYKDKVWSWTSPYNWCNPEPQPCQVCEAIMQLVLKFHGNMLTFPYWWVHFSIKILAYFLWQDGAANAMAGTASSSTTLRYHDTSSCLLTWLDTTTVAHSATETCRYHGNHDLQNPQWPRRHTSKHLPAPRCPVHQRPLNEVHAAILPDRCLQVQLLPLWYLTVEPAGSPCHSPVVGDL